MARHLALILAIALTACGSEPATGTAATTTYYRDVLPVLDKQCNDCHVEGGVAPFPLTTYEDAAPYAEMIAYVTEQKLMPPWPPGPGCNHYVGERALEPADIDVLTQWSLEGAPEGDPADAKPPLEMERGGLSRVDLQLQMAEEYLPNPPDKGSDDYRCFVIDWPETETKFVTGFSARPGETAVVHHVIAFLATGKQAKAYTDLDDQEPGPGYTCFGGPGDGGFQVGWLGAWVPGMASGDYPTGTGIKVEPNSKIILQVHYNTEAVGALPDRTTLEVKVDDAVEKQAVILPVSGIEWVFFGGMHIPPGEPDWKLSTEIQPSFVMDQLYPGGPISGDMLLHSAALHMHTRGSSGSMKLVRSGEKDPSECVLEIPRWDFHWQGIYQLQEPVLVHRGDNIELTCHWDSTGLDHELNWGEGTSDEMCLGVLFLSQP